MNSRFQSIKQHFKLSAKNLKQRISKKYFTESEDASFIVYQKSKPFYQTPLSSLPEAAVKSFSIYNDTEQLEYMLKVKGRHFIEPNHGWIFDSSLKTYLSYSFPHSELEIKPSYFKIKLKRHKILTLDRVISIRYHFHNYWHFINDVLGQIAYLDNLGIAQDTPILVPHGVMDIAYIKQIIESSPGLKDRNWVTHPRKTLVRANEIILAKNLPNTKKNFLGILTLLDVNSSQEGETSGGTRFFLERGKNRGRRLNNRALIDPILAKHGFQILDADTLTFKEQKVIFENASFVIGIHGAGLTNLIFRHSKPLQVLEIFPLNLIPPHYYWLSNQLGFNYNCLVGDAEINGIFNIDPASLEKLLAELSPLD